MHIQYQRTYIFKQLYDTYRLFFHCQPLLVRIFKILIEQTVHFHTVAEWH